ncbi:hypothetical protein ACHAXA_009372 [Cyclostephanos tholiformis]|uniref:Uncharacterized protein n=1 Tax=Cyclostephanos tholiformis TaxID=382380 RepID=A0ABD3RGW3_9STRA
MKLSISLVFIMASGACAQVVNPCLICRDGATAGDDFSPFAADGLNATCADLIEEIKGIEAASYSCMEGYFEDIRSMCCSDTLPENPCIVCSGGITAGEDFAPLAEGVGDPTTCKELVDSARGYGAESELCASDRDQIEALCCPATPDSPCIMCPDGVTAGDDFAPNGEYDEDPFTCKKYMDLFKTIEEGSAMCESSQYWTGGGCCPGTLPENPCIACPNGITAGDDFAPYAGNGYLKPCSKIIDEFRFLDAGHFYCGAEKDWEEALCCPTTPKNPCDICPNGLTAAEEFFPPNDGQTCKENIDTLMLVETDSKACSDWGQFYKVLCCPETSNAAATTASPATTTTLATATSASVASSSSDATSTPATGSSQLTTTVATAVASIEPTPSGGVTVFELRGFMLIISVSALSLIVFV